MRSSYYFFLGAALHLPAFCLPVGAAHVQSVRAVQAASSFTFVQATGFAGFAVSAVADSVPAASEAATAAVRRMRMKVMPPEMVRIDPILGSRNTLEQFCETAREAMHLSPAP